MLAVYGSLAPGEANHWVLSRIEGDWLQGTVFGHRFEITWGPAEGYDGFILDPDGSEVPVWVLRSTQLAEKWREIDEFEGEGYERLPVQITLAGGMAAIAQMYLARTDS